MKPRRIGEILMLARRAVTVDPLLTYREIGVRSFGKGIFHKEPVSGTDLGNKRVFEIHPGDLVLSNVFAWEGAVTVASDADRGRIGSHRFLTYVANVPDVDLSFVRYLFLSEYGLAQLNQASPGSAGRNKTLAIERFEALEIPLPDLDEQKRVSLQLDHACTDVSRLEALNDRSLQIANALLVALASSEAPCRPLEDVLTRQYDDVEVEPDGVYPTAGVYSFGRGLFERPPTRGSDTKYKKLNRIREGQLVFARLNAWEGGLAVVDSRFNGLFVSQEFPVFAIDTSQVRPAYIALLCRSPRLWDALMQRSRGVGARTGARRLRVHPDHLLRVEIPLPATDQQDEILAVASKLCVVKTLAEERRERASALVPALLNQVFGDLR